MSGRGEDSGRAWPFPLLLSAERASSEPAGVHSTFAADASGRSGDAFSGWHAGSTVNLLPVLAELPFVSEPPLVKRFTLLLPGDIDWWNDDTVGESDSANNAEVASDDRLGWMNRVGNIDLALHRQNPAIFCVQRHLTQPNFGKRTRLFGWSSSNAAGSDSVKLRRALAFFLNCGGCTCSLLKNLS